MAGEKVGSVYIEIQAKMGSLEKDLKQLESRLNNVDKKAQQTSSSFSTMGKYLAGGAIAGGILAIGKAALSASAAMEKNRVAFTTMLGSAEKANKLLKEMSDFSAATPFELTEIVTAGKSLLAFGTASEEIIPTLTRLGDVAAALNIPIGELSDLYGKARVQGTIFSEDLNQMAGRGIPIFTELAKVMNVNAGSIKKLASEGKISFALVEQAFKNMTKEGSQFGGLMEAQAQTLGGKWSNFQDVLGRTAVMLGDEMAPAAKDLLDIMTLLFSKFSSGNAPDSITMTGSLIKDIKAMLDGTKDKIDGISDAMGDLGDEMIEDIDAYEASSQGVSTNMEKILKKYGEVNGAAGLYTQYTSGQIKLTDAQVERLQKILALSKTISEQNDSFGRKNATDFVNKIAAMGGAKGSTDVKTGKTTTTGGGGGGKSAQDEANKKAYESRLVWLEKEQAMVEEYGSVAMAEFVADLEAKSQAFQQYTGVLTNMSGSLAQLSQMNASNQTAEVDNRLTKEMDAIEERYNLEKELIEQSVMTQEEKDAALKALDEKRAREEKATQEKAAKEKRKIAHEAAKQQKMLAMFDTIIATPTAAFQAFKALAGISIVGPALGAAAAAATTALGLAKLKLISDQPLPALAEGGIVPAVPGGNQFTIGEAGSAEAVIPLNDATLSRLAGMINSAGGGKSYAKLPPMSDTALFNTIFEASRNGNLYIDQRAVVTR